MEHHLDSYTYSSSPFIINFVVTPPFFTTTAFLVMHDPFLHIFSITGVQTASFLSILYSTPLIVSRNTNFTASHSFRSTWKSPLLGGFHVEVYSHLRVVVRRNFIYKLLVLTPSFFLRSLELLVTSFSQLDPLGFIHHRLLHISSMFLVLI